MRCWIPTYSSSTPDTSEVMDEVVDLASNGFFCFVEDVAVYIPMGIFSRCVSNREVSQAEFYLRGFLDPDGVGGVTLFGSGRQWDDLSGDTGPSLIWAREIDAVDINI